MSNDLEILIGKTILEINTSEGLNDIQFVTSDGDKFHFQCYGACCANAFISTLENTSNLIGQEITEVLAEDNSFEKSTNYVIDCVFYTIKSMKGRCFIDFRVEHNGYYGGDLRLILAPYDKKYNIEPIWESAKDTD